MPKDEYDKFWLNVQCTVDKDVVRTDRSDPYFAGKDNPNIEIMRQILLNYAYYQPETGYNQGMSDLLASILSTVQDEVDAFWCFVGLMEKSLFVTSPKDDSMDCQLLYLKELLRMMATKFYAHLLLEDEGMDLLFCHRWLLLGFKREFHDMHVMRMWEACWSHYQTEFFHIFICVAIVLEYGDLVWQKSMRVDEMLNYFNNLALEMDGDKVLRQARSLLYQFRRLAGIPCTLRGLLSGPGAWDSATLPEIECTCHETSTCKYSRLPTRIKSFIREDQDVSKKQQDGDEKDVFEINDEGKIGEISDEVKVEKEGQEREFNLSEQEKDSRDDLLESKEYTENGTSNLKDECPNEEQTVETYFSEEQQNDSFNPKEQQNNELTTLEDEIHHEEQHKQDTELNLKEEQTNDDTMSSSEAEYEQVDNKIHITDT